MDEYLLWLKRAESSLLLGKMNNDNNVFYEDLCFQLQQSVEKTIKAYLIFLDIAPPRTHSFKVLLEKIPDCPKILTTSIALEDYAVQTRYPGDYTPVDYAEYQQATKIAEEILAWVKSKITTPN